MKKVFFIIVFLAFAPFLTGCTADNTSDYYTEDDGQKIEIGNPYSEGSGHYAGYEWAERTGNTCSGNSTSFIEGCEEYYRQIESIKK